MAITEEKLLDAAIRCGLIEGYQLEALRLEARKKRYPLMAVVQAHFRFPMAILYQAIAEQNGLEYVQLHHWDVETTLLKKIPPNLLRRKQLLPMQQAGRRCLVLADPFDRAAIDSVQRLLGQALPIVLTDAASLSLAIYHLLAPPAESNTPMEETDLVMLLDQIIREAYLNHSSDIHLLAEKTGLRVRLRVDGKLRDFPFKTDRQTALSLISRVKVLSELDIAEQRQPQDGGFSYHLAAPIDCRFNIRVATVPIREGERVTMRLLDSESVALSLTDLGMLEADLLRFKQAINKPYGLVLLTGPTGSGKSTTLCAALQEINHPDINIMTVENPIEYVIEGVSQVQTSTKVSFASALRSFLRHDPDVLMVGEIRDHETADVALKAAMTGHRVFSTLHTNNAVSAVTRLADIGCEPFLIASTVNAVIAQRLVRRLCAHCREEKPVSEQVAQALGIETGLSLYHAVGCALCQQTGFRGRLGLFETLWFDDELSRMVAQGANEEALLSAAGERLQFMWQDGLEKVLLGLTTLDELRSVVVYQPQSTRKSEVLSG
ncbi:MAG: type II/IV secretion system protein [Methyloprofundus sp.]|nr:type II/IV secretion system protein [Methyloprofundus sp.]